MGKVIAFTPRSGTTVSPKKSTPNEPSQPSLKRLPLSQATLILMWLSSEGYEKWHKALKESLQISLASDSLTVDVPAHIVEAYVPKEGVQLLKKLMQP